MAPNGTAWLWKVPEGFPKGIHGAGTPEIDTVWDYKADGVLFEAVLAQFAAFWAHLGPLWSLLA